MTALTPLKKTLWTIVGFFGAFITISLVEFINSLLYPFPPGMSMTDLPAIVSFSKAQPPQLFVNVLIGWIVGTVVATMIIVRKTGEKRLAYISAGVLTLMALLNNFVFLPGVHPLWFTVVGLPLFFVTCKITCVYLKVK